MRDLNGNYFEIGDVVDYCDENGICLEGVVANSDCCHDGFINLYKITPYSDESGRGGSITDEIVKINIKDISIEK